MKDKVERLKQIKEETDKLHEERRVLESEVDDLIIYQNEDGTWTRFTKTNNIEELQEGKTVWKSCGMEKFSTKIENLKNEPKELKGK